jgi:prephenate dehydratase/chorismate mutase/prephenate dehydratase
MKLGDIRHNIDLIDSKILKLLNDRFEQGLMAKRFKDVIEDPKREKEIMERVGNSPNALIENDFSEQIYKIILAHSKKLQAQDLVITGFQGEHGAYSEEAVRHYNKNFVTVPCTTFNEVFEGVNSGIYDYGIVPVENTLGGNVGPVNELLINTDLQIMGAIDMPVHHSLMIVPGSDYREVREVYSHSQALAQCRRFLSRNNLTPVPYYDTAGAAKMLAEEQPRGAACIAGKLAAELYNLEIVKSNIEDLTSNRTRFLLLSSSGYDEEGSKSSIIFTTEHKSGTLFNVLRLFAEAGINLTRIESIPNEPGDYSYFLDFDGSIKDQVVTETLKNAEHMTTGLKILGCYNEIKVEL